MRCLEKKSMLMNVNKTYMIILWLMNHECKSIMAIILVDRWNNKLLKIRTHKMDNRGSNSDHSIRSSNFDILTG
jgi:hypothetical protein